MKHYIFPLLLLLSAISLLFAACTSDDPASDGKTLHGLSLQFGQRAATAQGQDPNAMDGEFIHSLHVFVVDKATAKVEWAAHETFPNDADAAAGNLLEKIYSNLSLQAGEKDIYAFANMENVYFTDDSQNTIDSKLNAINVGDDESSLASLSSKTVNNPAAAVDIKNKKFIPMSVRQSITLTTSNQSVRVEMQRLVVRVDLNITNTRDADITLTNLTMGKFATGVGFIEPVSSITRSTSDYTISSTDITLAKTNGTANLSFYVNATEDNGTDPFTLNAQISGETKIYQGTTTTTTLPRNSILPLAVKFSDYLTILNATANISPIGGYPVNVYTKEGTITGNYTVGIPEGSSFTLEVSMQKDGQAVQMKSVKFSTTTGTTVNGWKFGQTMPYTHTGTNGASFTSAPLSGIVSAQTGLTASLTVDTETSEGRKGTVTINLQSKGIEEFPLTTSTRKLRHSGNWTAPEEGYIVLPLR